MNNNDFDKIFVLDTNVLIHDAQSIFKFEDNLVVIPLVVLEELDNFKKGQDEKARNSRQFSRYMDDLRKDGDIAQGVPVDGGFLKVDVGQNLDLSADLLKENKPDNLIIATALKYKINNPDKKVVFISKDINLRIKASVLGIVANDYTGDKVDLDEMYSGVKVLEVLDNCIDLLFSDKEIELPEGVVCHPNEYVVLKKSGTSQRGIARYDVTKNKLVGLSPKVNAGMWGIKPKNLEQTIALDLLLNPEISLVSIMGKAGCGKTLLAVAAGLNCALDENMYTKLVVSRPIIPMGKDLGYLPGDINEKMSPWMKPIFDQLEFLLGGSKMAAQELIEQKMLEVEPLTYIRGRSMPKQYFIIDECFPGTQAVATLGGKKTLSDLYNRFRLNKEVPLVKTFNVTSNAFEYKKILNVWKKEERSLVEVCTSLRKIKCTPNHKFLTIEKEWKNAEHLKTGDVLLSSNDKNDRMMYILNEDQKQIILGSYLGDGHLENLGKFKYRLKEVHGINQSKYCAWKANMLGSDVTYIEKNGYSQKPAVSFQTKGFIYQKDDLLENKVSCPQWVLDQLDCRGLAVWFMDDGSSNNYLNNGRLETGSFDEDSQKRIVARLRSFGVSCEYCEGFHKKNQKYYFYISINKAGLTKLIELIAPYLHQDLFYKVKKEGYDFPNFGTYIWDHNFVNYTGLVVKSVKNLEKKEVVYDIEVADNHNFIICNSTSGKNFNVGGPIVHNCQNLSPHEIKTIITRAGEGTKIILTGDCEQIDNPFLDASSNGLSVIIDKFKDQKIAGHITLIKGERSELAEIASSIL